MNVRQRGYKKHPELLFCKVATVSLKETQRPTSWLSHDDYKNSAAVVEKSLNLFVLVFTSSFLLSCGLFNS